MIQNVFAKCYQALGTFLARTLLADLEATRVSMAAERNAKLIAQAEQAEANGSVELASRIREAADNIDLVWQGTAHTQFENWLYGQPVPQLQLPPVSPTHVDDIEETPVAKLAATRKVSSSRRRRR